MKQNYDEFRKRWIAAVMKAENICREQAELEFDEYIEDMLSDINDDIDSDNEHNYEMNANDDDEHTGHFY